MDKLLIIGAGIGQISIIKLAKEMGCHVTVVTIPGKWPAIELADDVWYLDIYDREGILKKAKEEGITAVTSDQNDLMMPTVAYIAENLGLPGNKFSQVMSYCNKNTFRDNCDKAGVPAPKHVAISDENFDVDSFGCPLPWIVKPADSQSSIGVQRIDKKEELKDALKKALDSSVTHSAILEEYFVGKEVVCEGFINQGKYYNLSFADRKYFDLENLLIPSQTVFPSQLPETIRNSIIESERKMAAYVGASFGITHSEYLYNEESGEIRVVETALRGGGVFISSHLIPFATGININEVLLKKVLGRDVDVDKVFEEKQNHASGYVCFYLKDGVVESVEGVEEIKALPFVKMSLVENIKVGEQTDKMTYKGARKGPIIVIGENRADLEKNILQVQNTLRISVRKDEAAYDGIVWA